MYMYISAGVLHKFICVCYVNVCVCMYRYLNVCMRMSIRTCMCMYMYVNLYVYVYIVLVLFYVQYLCAWFNSSAKNHCTVPMFSSFFPVVLSQLTRNQSNTRYAFSLRYCVYCNCT